MQHAVSVAVLGEHLVQSGGIAHIELMKLELGIGLKPRQVPVRSFAGEVIDYDDLGSGVEVTRSGVAPDESSPASDDDLQVILRTGSGLPGKDGLLGVLAVDKCKLHSNGSR